MRQVLGIAKRADLLDMLAVQARVVVRSSEDAISALSMGAEPAFGLMSFITDSRGSAEILSNRLFDDGIQRQLLDNIDNMNDAAVALRGGFLSDDIATKIARNVHSTDLAASILEQGRITSKFVQQALVGSFSRSNETPEAKSRSASKILRSAVSIHLDLVESIFSYVIKGSPQRVTTTSEDAAFALSQVQLDHETQQGLIRCINNSQDFAIALSGGFLDDDSALYYAKRISDPKLAALAFGKGANFSLEIQEALISSFDKSNCSKTDKAEYALSILQAGSIDHDYREKLQSYTASDVVSFEAASSAGLRANGTRVVDTAPRVDALSIEDVVILLNSSMVSSKGALIKTHAIELLASGIGAADAAVNGANLVALTKALIANEVNQEALRSLLETTMLGQQVLRQVEATSLAPQGVGDDAVGR
ncbi:MAG: hypothetical protein HON23_05720 [Rickettsiales bacterium]|nr:hypothetical protein [Rickettsiales bacterium]